MAYYCGGHIVNRTYISEQNWRYIYGFLCTSWVLITMATRNKPPSRKLSSKKKKRPGGQFLVEKCYGSAPPTVRTHPSLKQCKTTPASASRMPPVQALISPSLYKTRHMCGNHNSCSLSLFFSCVFFRISCRVGGDNVTLPRKQLFW